MPPHVRTHPNWVRFGFVPADSCFAALLAPFPPKRPAPAETSICIYDQQDPFPAAQHPRSCGGVEETHKRAVGVLISTITFGVYCCFRGMA